jgi:hypothetical protein
MYVIDLSHTWRLRRELGYCRGIYCQSQAKAKAIGDAWEALYCQPQAKAKAKAMPGRPYIHTITKCFQK